MISVVIFYTINGVASERSEHKISVSEANYQVKTADAGFTKAKRSGAAYRYLTE